MTRCSKRSATELAQRILEEQGCIYMSSPKALAIGSVIDEMRGDENWLPVPGPIVILAEATWEDLNRQSLRFWGVGITRLGGFIYKVMAE